VRQVGGCSRGRTQITEEVKNRMTFIVKDSRKLLSEYGQWRKFAVQNYELQGYRANYPQQFKQTFMPKMYVLHAYELPKGIWEVGTFQRYQPKKFDIVGFDRFLNKNAAQKFVYEIIKPDVAKPFDIQNWEPPKGGYKFKPYNHSKARFE